MKCKFTQDTIDFLVEQFEENNLKHIDAKIFADCGGLGKPMLDNIRKRGWKNIRYIDNRAKTTRPKTYKNYGAETWFNFAKLLEREEIIIIDDSVLIKQLSSRYYKIIDGAVHQLLSKLEQKSRGYPSPDRADACILAFCDYKSTVVESKEENKPFEVPKEKEVTIGSFSMKSWAKDGIGTMKGTMRGKYNLNGGLKNDDFNDIREVIAENNRRLKLQTIK